MAAASAWNPLQLRAPSVYNGSMVADEQLRLNRGAFSVAGLTDPDDAPDYWLSKTPQERLAAMEAMRQVVYGYTPASARLRRVLTVAEREGR